MISRSFFFGFGVEKQYKPGAAGAVMFANLQSNILCRRLKRIWLGSCEMALACEKGAATVGQFPPKQVWSTSLN